MNSPTINSRRQELIKHVRPDSVSVEVAPYFTPLLPKSAGYQCLSIDVFNETELRRQAFLDSNIPKNMVENIETVDCVGSAVEIAALLINHGVTSVSAIVSSHNFEHLPNPIRFLQGCESALTHDGWLSMAVPDRRGCFDYYRQASTLSALIEAYLTNKSKPSLRDIFEHKYFSATDTAGAGSFLQCTPREKITATNRIKVAYAEWLAAQQTPEIDRKYIDAHCWVYTISSFQLLISQLRLLGLTTLSIDEVWSEGGNEFIVHLKKVPLSSHSTADDQNILRTWQLAMDEGGHSRDDVRIKELLAANANAQIKLNELLTSRSWRYMAPLRKAAGVLRWLKRR